MEPAKKAEIDCWEYRGTMGMFATGVTVVALETDNGIVGMTANAVTSVSLDPLLVLVCVHKKARIMKHLPKAQKFSISILNENQEDLSRYFANMWTEPEPPVHSFLAWDGVLRLADTIGAIACRLHDLWKGRSLDGYRPCLICTG
jgi:flavin reductase (DIM6/NTAB) family NADH-FMN oxidoreductase RutF